MNKIVWNYPNKIFKSQQYMLERVKYLKAYFINNLLQKQHRLSEKSIKIAQAVGKNIIHQIFAMSNSIYWQQQNIFLIILASEYCEISQLSRGLLENRIHSGFSKSLKLKFHCLRQFCNQSSLSWVHFNFSTTCFQFVTELCNPVS